MKEFEQAGVVLNIPEKCENCPRLAALAKVAMSARVRRECAIDAAMSDTLASEVRKVVDDEEMAETVLQAVGQRTVDMLEEIDQKLASVKELAGKAVAACDGPLKMRASKGERIYTTTICTSAAAPMNETFLDDARVTIAQE